MTEAFTLRAVAELLEGTLIGDVDPDVRVTGVAAIQDAGSGEICYFGNRKYAGYLEKTEALAVIVSDPCITSARSQIVVKDSYDGFRKVLALFSPDRTSGFSGIHPTATVHPSAVIGRGVFVGPSAVIDRDCSIGEGSFIGPCACLGPDVKVGEHSVIHSNVSLLAETMIGSFTIIHAGSVLGSDGFGFVPSSSGSHKKVPQNGNVVIGDHVEIGSNCSIDRSVTGSTVVGDHTKLDNLIQVAHNVRIGNGCMIAAQTGIAGSTVIGNGVVIGGQVGINGHIVIHDGAVIAAKSGVTKSVPAGLTVSGNPCRPHGETLRIGASAARLPDLIAELKRMTEGIETED